MRVAVLFSGGKDSCYAVWVLQHLGWEVARLVTVKPSAQDSMMFHYPSLDWTGLQAQAKPAGKGPAVAVKDEGEDVAPHSNQTVEAEPCGFAVPFNVTSPSKAADASVVTVGGVTLGSGSVVKLRIDPLLVPRPLLAFSRK